MPDKIINGVVYSIENPEELIENSIERVNTPYENEEINRDFEIIDEDKINYTLDFIYDIIIKDGKIENVNNHTYFFSKNLKIAQILRGYGNKIRITTAAYEDYGIKDYSYISITNFLHHKINDLIDEGYVSKNYLLQDDFKKIIEEKDLKDFIKEKNEKDFSDFITLK
jgi:hypothetical protein